MTKVEKIAKFIVNEHNENKKYINLPVSLKPQNIEEAYLAQTLFHKNVGRGNLGGYKIALASKIQQELCGINHPVAGGIFKNEIFNSPYVIEYKNYFGLGLEFELAMEMSDDLTNDMGVFTKESIKKYISNIYAAFEMIIDRDANYNDIDAYSMAADNAWCGGVVLGNAINDWQKVDYENQKSLLHWNDETPQKANLIDSNPFESLAWVVNLKLSQNTIIPKGSKIITGSVIKTRSPKIGDKIVYEIPNLSSVEIKII